MYHLGRPVEHDDFRALDPVGISVAEFIPMKNSM